MSTRQIRRLQKQMQEASVTDKPPETAQEEFEPHYVGAAGPAYAELPVGMDSTDDGDNSTKGTNQCSSSETEMAVGGAIKKKKNKNNKKKRNKNKRLGTVARNSEDSEDVDRAIAEVNELLGEPEAPKPEPVKIINQLATLLKINHKYLSGNDELTRLFGPDEDDGPRRRPQHDSGRHHRRQIVLSKETFNFSVKGLSMKLIGVTDGIRYYKYVHGTEYQRNKNGLVQALRVNYNNYLRQQEWAYEVYVPTTIEALVSNMDIYFQLDETNLAVDSLEQAINYLQCVSHQSFSYLDGKCRLEYKYIENRVFHIVLLKYLYIQTNKACHRTALEIAKLMINLDPSDPLGVIFIIDTLALRAREHLWLKEIFGPWSAERGASCLFHMRYSYALALYKLYMKNHNEETLLYAEKILTTSIMRYPNVVALLMKHCQLENPGFTNHEICKMADQMISEDLKKLMALYAKFSWPKWREQNAMAWVVKNATEVANGFDNDEVVRSIVLQKINECAHLFKKNPLEIKRHLHIITPMSDLLSEGAVPAPERTIAFNPYPDHGVYVDVNSYYRNWGLPQNTTDENQGVLRSFIQSLVPEGPPENREG